ncbi:MAG: right-handed parallel beta-helix repeat-containing protein [Anaerolineae bacterium]|nr:right-handed parallel beta-helix repeat-containing protein [Anaerolineae bacterium]
MKICLRKLHGMGLLFSSLLGALALGMAILLVVNVSAPASPLAAQDECDRYVLGIDAGDHGDCSDEAHPCRTVRYAVQQAASGDRICVAKHTLAGPLTYTGTIAITKSLVLDGAWDAMCIDPSDLTCSFTAIPCNPANVTLDAQGAGRVISISGGIGGNGVITPVIDCFTITGGDGAGLGGVKKPNENFEHDAGGGIYSCDAAPIIRNDVITGNFGGKSSPTYGHGGGVCLVNAPSTAVIYNNLIAHNIGDASTTGAAGGVLLFDSDAQVISNTIYNNRAANSAGQGGGIAVMGGQPTLTANEIYSNAGSSWMMALGGGVYISSTGTVTLVDNRIHHNQGLINAGGTPFMTKGGGVYAGGEPDAVVVMENNEIHYNIASPYDPYPGQGGGVYLYNLRIPSEVRDNTIHDNVGGFNGNGDGGGLYLENSVTLLEDNVIYNNAASWSGDLGAGGGLYINGGQARLADNTITYNRAVYLTGPPNTATVGFGGGVYVSYTTAFSSSNNTVAYNQAATDGGGMYLNSLTGGLLWYDQLTHNSAAVNGGGVYAITTTLTSAGSTFFSNTAASGGGFYLKDNRDVVLSNNSFRQNTVTDTGGGTVVFGGAGLTLTHNLWDSNSASKYAGGLYVQTSEYVAIDHNDFIQNDAGATSIGGAYCVFNKGVRFVGNKVYANTGDGVTMFGNTDTWLDNNIIAGNGDVGVGIYGGTPHLRHNTIAANHTGLSVSGVFMLSDCHASLTNTILAGNTTGISITNGNTATLAATLWGGGAWSNGQDYGGAGSIDIGTINLYEDPQFIASALGDYHVQHTSPAVNAGVETSVHYDIDGEVRITPDLGADEAIFSCFLPLVLRQF